MVPCLDAGAQQQAAQQPGYQPAAPVVIQPMNNQPLTTGQFFLMDLILAIPLVGLIMCFVWAFGDASNPNRKAWAKAKLIWILIGVVLTILFVVLFAGAFASIVNRSPTLIKNPRFAVSGAGISNRAP